MSKKKGKLFLIPSLLGGDDPSLIPFFTMNQVEHLDSFIVENLREARRFIAKMKFKHAIDDMFFQAMDKHQEVSPAELIQPLLEGRDTGLISDAGLPAVADPGSEVVAEAHRQGIQVIPLIGPSSIFMALMASGMNGQNFQFHGYLPIKEPMRGKAIKRLEDLAMKTGGAQIFMETPYRNNKLLDEVYAKSKPNTRLCVAVDLSLPTEWIKTMTIKNWKVLAPDIHKRPAIFVLGK